MGEIRPATPPAWYPDPSGTGQRYFDGSKWTEHWAPVKSSTPSTFPKGAVVACAAIVGVALFAGVVAFVYSAYTAPTAPIDEHPAQDAIDACQQSVKKMLKDPDSARFDDWTASQGGSPPAGMVYAPASGDVYYSAHGMVNAKNGFGGYTGDEPYTCDAVVTANTVRAQARTANG
jgi:hypothetical protein